MSARGRQVILTEQLDQFLAKPGPGAGPVPLVGLVEPHLLAELGVHDRRRAYLAGAQASLVSPFEVGPEVTQVALRQDPVVRLVRVLPRPAQADAAVKVLQVQHPLGREALPHTAREAPEDLPAVGDRCPAARGWRCHAMQEETTWPPAGV